MNGVTRVSDGRLRKVGVVPRAMQGTERQVWRIVALVAASSLLAVSLPAGRADNGIGDEFPLVSAAYPPGNGSAVLRIHNDGSPFVVSVGSFGRYFPNGGGYTIYDSAGVLVDLTSYLDEGETGAFVEVGPATVNGYLPHSDSGFGGSLGGYYNTGNSWDGHATGDLTLVFWTSGAQESWSYEIRGGPGTTVLSGPVFENRTFAYDSKDFSGALNVGAMDFPVGARAQIATSLTIPVKGTFVGFVLPSLESYDVLQASDGKVNSDNLTLETPAHEFRTCPCTLGNTTGTDAFGAGNFTFHLTGASAGIHPEINDAAVVGADVTIPPP
jgi:hypothetical protein